ncbi:unnamed protein product [Strongylus vulgaris]|uniref:Uncharacterized protein n=1 Tax=Strongylus vulgaris TaxID=40348 RepID=A0A3P7J707_STRVU|nr:unnamed protein product [Strongylus vulgaris]
MDRVRKRMAAPGAVAHRAPQLAEKREFGENLGNVLHNPILTISSGLREKQRKWACSSAYNWEEVTLTNSHDYKIAN